LGRGDEYRRVIQEENSLLRFGDKLADRFFSAAFWLNEIPFVQDHDRGLAVLLNHAGDSFVLRGNAAGKIDNEDAEVGAADASLGPHHAEDLYRCRMRAAPADSRGVDEDESLRAALVGDVNGITGSAGKLT